MKKLILPVLALTFLSGCIKTAEQVRREKRFDSVAEQVHDSQGLVAEMSDQMRDTQTQLDRLNGRLEELEHRQKQNGPELQKKTDETLSLIKTQQETQSTQILMIQNELKEQRAFLEKVTAQLSNMGHTKEAPQNSKKKSARDEVFAALTLVQKNKYDDARTALEAIMDDPELTPGDQNKILHGLGRTEYHTKNYDKAMVYFSKIYSKYPQSSLAPSSLLYIGKSLRKLGKRDEAKEALSKLMEDYPSSKEALTAKKEL
jgi:TolA-binding protein